MQLMPYFYRMSVEYSFRVRRAEEKDLAFAERLYIGTMEPLLKALGAWDHECFSRRIRASYKAEESRIILVGDKEVGWMQVTPSPDDLNLAQIHLVEPVRGGGIGTRLVRDLLEEAARAGKTVSLSTPRNNRAIGLYERLGFVADGNSEDTLVHMVWRSGERMRPTSDVHHTGTV